MKIKAYTYYDEYTNSRYYKMFEVEENLPEDTYHGEKIIGIRPAPLDCEQNFEVRNYDFFVVCTISEEGEYSDNYICVEHSDRLTFGTDFVNYLDIYTHDVFDNVDRRITIFGQDEFNFLYDLVKNWSEYGLCDEPTEQKIKEEWKNRALKYLEHNYDFRESRSYVKVAEMIISHFSYYIDYVLKLFS